MKWPALAAGLVLVAGTCGRAWAGDGENAVSAAVGVATYATPNEDMDETLRPLGGGWLGATYERGFGDYAAWRLNGAGALYGGGSGGGTVMSGIVTAGLSYRVDVLRYVPYVAVGVGGIVRAGGPFETGVEPVLELAGGVDWLKGRDRSWGVAGSLTGFASDTTTFSIGVRSTWRWGYF
ncbi:MAG TPA: hypothetical protein VM261_26465 [Kofleriaceae bacterium]|nr:hypothetical protein [Kofleriaceae bacterium]